MLRAGVTSSFVRRRTGHHVIVDGKWNGHAKVMNQTQTPLFQNLSRNFWFGGNNDNNNDGSDNKKKDAKKKKEEEEKEGKADGPEMKDTKHNTKEQKATVFKTDDDTTKTSAPTTISTLLPTKLSFGDDSPRYPHLTALPVITRPLFPGIVSSVTLTDPVSIFHVVQFYHLLILFSSHSAIYCNLQLFGLTNSI